MANAAVPSETKEIDLDVVRELVSQFQPSDWQEGQELILSALQEINGRFGYVGGDKVLDPSREA